MTQKVLTMGGGACPAKASSAKTVHGIDFPAATLNAASTATLNATSVTSAEPVRLVAGATVVGS